MTIARIRSAAILAVTFAATGGAGYVLGMHLFA